MKITNLFDLLIVFVIALIVMAVLYDSFKEFVFAGIVIIALVLYVIIAAYIRQKFFDKK
ncbi:hypothetical protein AB4865_07385 [Capnocytophaga sp. ARDL2]|uniref:hypothetical protein n=1 Tax=Capnocytophaga sp. ARDL2 TaxID=3238809 RepID=UPI0035592717